MVFGKQIVMLSAIVVVFSIAHTAEALKYSSFIFSTYDIVLFSYEDGTVLEIYEKDGSPVIDWRGNPVVINGGNPLSKGKYVRLIFPFDLTSFGKTYLVTGSKKFSVLIGDAAYGWSGYHAMDQNGKSVSTEFYTYVPPKTLNINGYQKFVVFAYEDGTELTVECADPNQIYHEVVTDFPLDKGQNWSSEDLSGEYVHVASNKPVSALSCYDTGYFVPSADGQFSGTKFYTYIGKTRYGLGNHSPQDMVVTAYDDDTQVMVADCNEPGVVTWQGTLNSNEVHVERFPDGLNEPVSITSTSPVTVSVQQWVTDEADWVPHGFFVPGKDGTGTGGLGRDILVSNHQVGYLIIMAHMDDTSVKAYNAETSIFVEARILSKGEFWPVYFGNGLWRIVSDKPISSYAGIESWPGHGQFYFNAEFSPLLFNVTDGEMVKVGVRAGFASDCTEPQDPNHCFEPADPNNNEICYTIAYWSDPNDDTDVVITDYLPREMEFISADPCDNGFYDPNNHTYTWDIGEVTGGDPCSYCYITVRITERAQPGDEIINKVELASHTSYSTAQVSTLICCPQDPIIYVKADAQGFCNGTSWQDAYTKLQPALTRARSGFGSEIWVAAGVYNPSKYIIRARFELLDRVEMYGGFAGDETSRDERDFVRNKTYLSGDIDAEGNYDSFGVVYAGWGLDDSVLDGFVIIKGNEWAGLYCNFNRSSIRNCVIRKNREHGIICDKASPRIENCRIEDNEGSGLYSAAGLNHIFAGRPIVKRCVIRANRIGLESRDYGRPIITNSWIYYNTREGISLTDADDSVIIRDNTIVGNGGYGIKSNQQVNLSNCIIWGNNTQLSTNCNAIYSCIQGGATGEGNISNDPCFAYEDPNDYHLGPDSLCIDVGHDPNGDGTYYDNLDIDGNVRVYNGRVDIGADEVACDDIYNSLDWNVDAIVDVDDFVVFAAAWLSDPCDPCDDNWNPNCDIQPENGDGDVEYGDFAVFGVEWLWEPCWTTSGPSAPMMMGMGGGMGKMAGGESMLMAEQQAESQQSYSEPMVEEQIEQIKQSLACLSEIKDQVEDKDACLGIANSLEEMLKELEDSQ